MSDIKAQSAFWIASTLLSAIFCVWSFIDGDTRMGVFFLFGFVLSVYWLTVLSRRRGS